MYYQFGIFKVNQSKIQVSWWHYLKYLE